MLRGAVSIVAPLLLGGAILAGCGADVSATPTGLKLQREDLIARARALAQANSEVEHEVAASKTSWPLIANGLSQSASASANQVSAFAAVTKRAAELKLPGLFEESRARPLTGPASGLASEFRRFRALSAQGWRLIDYFAGKLAQGSPGPAGFARANSALYVESIYDAHFGLAQIGKQLLAGYARLGGAKAFGEALTESEAHQLAEDYSEERDRLHPHAGVKRGS